MWLGVTYFITQIEREIYHGYNLFFMVRLILKCISGMVCYMLYATLVKSVLWFLYMNLVKSWYINSTAETGNTTLKWWTYRVVRPYKGHCRHNQKVRSFWAQAREETPCPYEHVCDYRPSCLGLASEQIPRHLTS